MVIKHHESLAASVAVSTDRVAQNDGLIGEPFRRKICQRTVEQQSGELIGKIAEPVDSSACGVAKTPSEVDHDWQQRAKPSWDVRALPLTRSSKRLKSA